MTSRPEHGQQGRSQRAERPAQSRTGWASAQRPVRSGAQEQAPGRAPRPRARRRFSAARRGGRSVPAQLRARVPRRAAPAPPGRCRPHSRARAAASHASTTVPGRRVHVRARAAASQASTTVPGGLSRSSRAGECTGSWAREVCAGHCSRGRGRGARSKRASGACGGGAGRGDVQSDAVHDGGGARRPTRPPWCRPARPRPWTHAAYRSTPGLQFTAPLPVRRAAEARLRAQGICAAPGGCAADRRRLQRRAAG